ncbi:SH3 domain-containing protein [Streptomyces sp. B1866]|uniref:SH3 domain-containing protein n=1 Tax=Streptomyces sp. B1866 TaxID=3075431 RepID=UPI00288C9C65|nr:SH3 domain-containing protein [Streptomyces sp. B1866]MDT3400337.1 SH3 domain-containing protein [Streptomyces sp. B1866]
MAVEETADTTAGSDQDRPGTQEPALLTAEALLVTQAAAVTYPVAPGCRLNVRSGPSTTSALVKVLPFGARVAIRCQCRGQSVRGPYGTSDIWDSIGPGQYVADAYVNTGSDGFVTAPCG